VLCGLDRPARFFRNSRWEKVAGRTRSVGVEGAAEDAVAGGMRADGTGGEEGPPVLGERAIPARSRSLQRPLLPMRMRSSWPTNAKLSLTGKHTKRRSAIQCKKSA